MKKACNYFALLGTFSTIFFQRKFRTSWAKFFPPVCRCELLGRKCVYKLKLTVRAMRWAFLLCARTVSRSAPTSGSISTRADGSGSTHSASTRSAAYPHSTSTPVSKMHRQKKQISYLLKAFAKKTQQKFTFAHQKLTLRSLQSAL